MKKVLFTAIFAIASVGSVWAQHPDAYVADGLDENFYSFIQAPPELTSGEFAYDFFHYQYGRGLRDLAGVSEQALFDVCTDAYQTQLKKARDEYQGIVNGAVSVRQAKIVEHPAASQSYTVSGTPASGSSRGIIIQDGQKTVGH